MKLLDSTVLLEFFCGSEERINRIDRLFRNLERRKEKLLITQEVITELIYYLEVVYKWEREVIADIVNTILKDSLFSVENRETIQRALIVYLKAGLSFMDSLKTAKAESKKVKEAVSHNKRFEKAKIRVIHP